MEDATVFTEKILIERHRSQRPCCFLDVSTSASGDHRPILPHEDLEKKKKLDFAYRACVKEPSIFFSHLFQAFCSHYVSTAKHTITR
mmetsp:Transcript_28360/g.42410  ORF Transcript_28360/g.42410 Transcript_28360/m.42410 type:complete len:87 (-) Transcript_28360:128-388(-)